MRLVTASKVLATMGIGENAGSLANAAHVSGVSFSEVENLLETSLAEEHRTDYFEAIAGESCLRLTNMFVDGDSVIVRRSTNSAMLTSPIDGELVDKSEYVLDAAKGLLTFRSQPIYPCSVAYDSGLPASTDDADLLIAPVWLQDIAIALSVYGLNILQTSVTNRKDRNITNISNELRSLASVLLNSRKRPRLVVTFPSLSELDE